MLCEWVHLCEIKTKMEDLGMRAGFNSDKDTKAPKAKQINFKVTASEMVLPALLFLLLPTFALTPQPSSERASQPPASFVPWCVAPPGHVWRSLWCAASPSQPRQLSGPTAWPPPLRSGLFQPAGQPSVLNAAGGGVGMVGEIKGQTGVEGEKEKFTSTEKLQNEWPTYKNAF